MAKQEEDRWLRLERGLRRGAWGAGALLLLAPVVAMRFTDEVDWTTSDFVFAAVLIGGTGLAYELAARTRSQIAYRAGAAVALGAVFLLIWINAAVGIIGSEDHPANLMYAGVLAVGGAGAFVARLHPEGMARALVATAAAQALVGVITLALGLGAGSENWPRVIYVLNGFFAALWLLSAWLFRVGASGRD